MPPKTLTILGFTSLCALAGCAAKHAAVQEVTTATNLKSRMDAGEVMIVHALDKDNYDKGHIPGAVNIDYEKMTPELLPKDKNQPMVFYCVGGMCPVGRMAANKAADWGYLHVWVYSGGLRDWQRAGMATAKGP